MALYYMEEVIASENVSVWIGSGSAAGGSGTSWSDYNNWTIPPTSLVDVEITFVSDGTLNIESNADAKYLYVEGLGSIQLQTIGSLSTACQYIDSTFTQCSGTNHAGEELYVGYQPGSSGTYELKDTGELSSNYSQVIGYYGIGTFRQTGGINCAGNAFILGYFSSSIGTYELSGDSQLSSKSHEYIGSFGVGILKQSGGTNSTSTLIVGRDSLSNGTYELSGTGQLSSRFDQYIGSDGKGIFKQTGGANFVGRTLYIGTYSGSSGTYELSGTGQLSSTGNQYVGSKGRGVFKQTGGTNSVGGHLFIGDSYFCPGNRYELSGTGQLSSKGNQYVGFYDKSTFKQTGGTNYVGNNLYLAYGSTYELSGYSQLTSVNNQIIAYYGGGSFKQTGGTNCVGNSLSLGDCPNSIGTYEICGGSLSANTINVAVAGTGRFVVSDISSEIRVSEKLRFGSNSTLTCVPDAEIHMAGAIFQNESTDAEALAGLANLEMIFESRDKIGSFEVSGEDMGAVISGFESNFAIGTLQIGGEKTVGQLKLVDLFDNQLNWEGNEALYVKKLILGEGSSLDLNGLNLYYQALTNLGGTINTNGGNLVEVPEPSVFVLLVGLLILGLRRLRESSR